MPGVEHRRHKGLNNRAENSHQPTRRREKIMKRFKSARQLQRIVSIHDPIANLFHFPRHALSSYDHRDLRSVAMATWCENHADRRRLKICSVSPTAFSRQ
jgi:putative transposase